MDTYAHLIKQVMQEHEARGREDVTGQVSTHFIYDDHNHEYLMVNVGWRPNGHSGPRRVHGIVFHAWVEGDKIWIERDNVLPSVSQELVERGVPATDILSADEQVVMVNDG